MTRMEIERIKSRGRTEDGELDQWAESEIEAHEALIRLEEERQKRVREQKMILENDLMKEQRRLTAVEAILDEWLDSL